MPEKLAYEQVIQTELPSVPAIDLIIRANAILAGNAVRTDPEMLRIKSAEAAALLELVFDAYLNRRPLA